MSPIERYRAACKSGHKPAIIAAQRELDALREADPTSVLYSGPQAPAQTRALNDAWEAAQRGLESLGYLYHGYVRPDGTRERFPEDPEASCVLYTRGASWLVIRPAGDGDTITITSL